MKPNRLRVLSVTASAGARDVELGQVVVSAHGVGVVEVTLERRDPQVGLETVGADALHG
jgi:hypothetical protein